MDSRSSLDSDRTVGGPAGPASRVARLPRGTNVERYVLLGVIGRGGMGVVYRAYDPELDRHVALKFLASGSREDDEGRERLMAEAKALARFTHPNVVVIYDVGEYLGHVFIAMELVEGRTLAQWRSARPRAVQEVIAVFVAAGEGLAAAHTAGIVHQDFKPANLIIGNDGRVRVLDFGLAAIIRQPESESSRVTDKITGPSPLLRLASRAAGTVPYMSPEQIREGTIDPRGDQYAFCVALFESLFDQRPYVGDDFRSSYLAKCEPPRIPKVNVGPRGERVPSWVGRILLSGLQPEPSERFADMHALLARLSGESVRRRRWASSLIGAAAACIAAGYVGHGWLQPARSEACFDGQTRVADVWNDRKREAMRNAFLASRRPYAEDTVGRASEGVEAYLDAWVHARDSACSATEVDRTQPYDMLELRLTCLDERLAHVESLVDRFASSDANVVDRAIVAVHALPGLERCADLRALSLRVPPPEDPVRHAAWLALRDDLARARSLGETGQTRAAVERFAKLETRARALDYAPLTAEILIERVRAERHDSDPKVRRTHLLEAVGFARVSDEVSLELRAWQQLIWNAGVELRGFEQAEGFYAYARTLLGLLDDPRATDARLTGTWAVVLASNGRYRESVAVFEQTLSMLGSLDVVDERQMAGPFNNIARTLTEMGEIESAAGYYRQSVQILERTRGKMHPDTLSVQANRAELEAELGNGDDALAILDDVLAMRQATFGERSRPVAHSLHGLARVARLAGRSELAGRHARHALEMLGSREDEPALLAGCHYEVAMAARADGRARAAGEHLRRAAAFAGEDLKYLAPVEIARAEIRLEAGDHSEACAILEPRLSALETMFVAGHPILAQAQFVLARARAGESERVEEAVALARRALVSLESSEYAWGPRPEAIATWLAEHDRAVAP